MEDPFNLDATEYSNIDLYYIWQIESANARQWGTFVANSRRLDSSSRWLLIIANYSAIKPSFILLKKKKGP